MPFCPSCGNQAEGRFCARCGASLDAPPSPPQSASSYAPPPPPPSASSNAANALPENAAAALCYLLGVITGVLFLVLEPYSRNPKIRFHAMQSILFTIASMVFYIGELVVMWILPLFLKILLGLFQFIVALAFFGCWLFLMWKTYQGEKIVLPIIGPIAEGQSRS